MTANVADKIWDYLHSNEQDMLQFLKELVAIESPSKNIEKQQQILQFIKKKLEKIGFFVFVKSGKKIGGYLYARPLKREKKKPLQLLIGHSDTVWKINTIKEMPIEKLNDKMTGPGIYDMKAGITQIYFAIKALKVLNIPLNITPIIFINTDEEIGSKESTPIIKRLAKLCKRAYIMEPPLGLEGKLKTARKGIGRFTIRVKGKAAHAGLDPRKGVNAIVELSYQVQKLYEMNDFERGITVNVGMIEGGISANVVAPESRAVIDVRVLNEVDGKYISSRIKKLKPMLPDTELVIEGSIGRPPMEKNERNQKLWHMAKDQGDLIGLNLQEATAGGGSDGNTTSLYTATLDGLGSIGDGAHATHEHILYKKLPERAALLALLILADN